MLKQFVQFTARHSSTVFRRKSRKPRREMGVEAMKTIHPRKYASKCGAAFGHALLCCAPILDFHVWALKP